MVWILIKMSLHVFMDFLLKIDSNLSIGTYHYIRAHTFVSRHITIRVCDSEVCRVIVYFLLRQVYGFCDEFILDALLRNSSVEAEQQIEIECKSCFQRGAIIDLSSARNIVRSWS